MQDERRKSFSSLQPNQHADLNKQRQYELLKSMLPIDLSSAEYEAACQRIARELGI